MGHVLRTPVLFNCTPYTARVEPNAKSNHPFKLSIECVIQRYMACTKTILASVSHTSTSTKLACGRHFPKYILWLRHERSLTAFPWDWSWTPIFFTSLPEIPNLERPTTSILAANSAAMMRKVTPLSRTPNDTSRPPLPLCDCATFMLVFYSCRLHHLYQLRGVTCCVCRSNLPWLYRRFKYWHGDLEVRDGRSGLSLRRMAHSTGQEMFSCWWTCILYDICFPFLAVCCILIPSMFLALLSEYRCSFYKIYDPIWDMDRRPDDDKFHRPVPRKYMRIQHAPLADGLLYPYYRDQLSVLFLLHFRDMRFLIWTCIVLHICHDSTWAWCVTYLSCRSHGFDVLIVSYVSGGFTAEFEMLTIIKPFNTGMRPCKFKLCDSLLCLKAPYSENVDGTM